MLGLLFWIVVGLALLLAVPSLIAPYTGGNPIISGAIRVIGALFLFFGVLSTSFVHVPDGYLGQLFRVYGGGSLTEGRIVAVHGENGPQADLHARLPPGCWSTSSTTSTPASPR